MGLIKFLFGMAIAFAVIFFVWTIFKRIFISKINQLFPHLNQQNFQTKNQHSEKKQPEKKVKWDAETIDYEEIKE